LAGKVDDATLAQTATALGIVIDKAQLLKGLPTNISSSVLSDDERKLRLAGILAHLAERTTPPQATEPANDTDHKD